MLAETQEKSEQILEEARELFLRVKYGTDNPTLSKEAYSSKGVWDGSLTKY